MKPQQRSEGSQFGSVFLQLERRYQKAAAIAEKVGSHSGYCGFPGRQFYLPFVRLIENGCAITVNSEGPIARRIF